MSADFSENNNRDLTRDKTLYVVGYSHLDSQWRWDYRMTIDRYLRKTLEDNFKLLEKYPEYVFSFTGSARYAMMKEYYPEHYQQLKKYIAEGRWCVSGSSVDECDVLVPSPESVLRQILYGNQYFRKEFAVESKDFMLPDCFGFPAYLPTLWAHTGLLGFSTQKLSWGSVVGIPFNVGVWEGPDGHSVIAALNATPYVSSVDERLDVSETWVGRVNRNGEACGVFADYRYYGVGDMGGAPRESDVQQAIASVGNKDRKIEVVLASSGQMYEEITPRQKEMLPRYKGELMLTEHSSGVLTSQAYMKRWNRKNEQLADAAERAAVFSCWLGGTAYPSGQIRRAWRRMLASQMHDILPGTTLPKGYEYAWNDEILASNGFASVLTHSMGGVSGALDTRVKGQAVVVYNPLSIERQEAVTARVRFEKNCPNAVQVYDDKGNEVPSQVLSKGADEIEILFLAAVPSVGAVVYEVRPADVACSMPTGLCAGGRVLENKFYRVELNEAGDLSGVYDKTAQRELLSRPARLEFHRSVPQTFPAWNMDWNDRKKDAIGYVDGPAAIEVAENGPVRVAIEVRRQANNSVFVQRIGLAAGDGGKRVEVHNEVDWQSSACVLKAAFSLTVANPKATYTQGLGTIQRGNNHPLQYEVLSHEWFDLTDASGEYGVSILEDCKFGSDKPADDIVRLSLLYTPGTRMEYRDQQTQDFGRHEFIYALYGHADNWQEGMSEYQGRRLNQPLRAFQVEAHGGPLGRAYSLLRLNTQQVDVRAIKKSEEGDWVVIRLQELLGKEAKGVVVSFGEGIASGYEIDGQERTIGQAAIVDGKLNLDMGQNAIRSFAVKPAEAICQVQKPDSKAVALAYNANAFSRDGQSQEGVFGPYSMPAERMPATLDCDGISFVMGKPDTNNTVRCQRQTIPLPKGDFNRVYILAAADEDTEAQIQIGDKKQAFSVQGWTGYVGQYDRRIWDREFADVDYNCVGYLTAIKTGYIKRDTVAWFCTHRHNAAGQNEAYRFSYIFKYGFDLPKGVSEITLPDNGAIKVFAVSVARDMSWAEAAGDLYDNFEGRREIVLRKTGHDEGRPAEGTVEIQRVDRYADLKFQPLSKDYADPPSGEGVECQSSTGDYSVPPGWKDEGETVRIKLRHGQVGQDHDDLGHCTFCDRRDGRIVIDLPKPVSVLKVNAFSRHHSERAAQKFSLWAGRENASPGVNSGAGDTDGWILVATVNSRPLGEGGVHASSVSFPKHSTYQSLMLISNPDNQGTFFNEIDVIVSE